MGIRVQACGDAHLANFGIFASAERCLVFDINDFDETLPAPWEWDLKRLVTSVEICGRHLGLSEADRLVALRSTVRGYHQAMSRFSKMGNLDVWYAHLDVEELLQEHADYLNNAEKSALAATAGKAIKKTNSRAVEKFTETVDGELRVVSDPPLLILLRDLASYVISQETIVKVLGAYLARYRLTLPRERRSLIDQYTPQDMARKAVGVGSVGMRVWIIVLEGAAPNDSLCSSSRKQPPRFSSHTRAKASFSTMAGGSWRDSGPCRRPATFFSAGLARQTRRASCVTTACAG